MKTSGIRDAEQQRVELGRGEPLQVEDVRVAQRTSSRVPHPEGVLERLQREASAGRPIRLERG